MASASRARCALPSHLSTISISHTRITSACLSSITHNAVRPRRRLLSFSHNAANTQTHFGLEARRALHHSSVLRAAPKSKDRGPASKEDTQTDFAAMNILSSMPVPTTAVDACMDDGFALDSGLKVTNAGVLLVGGEAFAWRPWLAAANASSSGSGNVASGSLRNSKQQFAVHASVWGVLDLVWPKPDLLVIGTGATICPLSPDTRADLAKLGIRVEMLDTRNAAAQFNLLATERGVQNVAAALVPVGWKDKRG